MTQCVLLTTIFLLILCYYLTRAVFTLLSNKTIKKTVILFNTECREKSNTLTNLFDYHAYHEVKRSCTEEQLGENVDFLGRFGRAPQR